MAIPSRRPAEALHLRGELWTFELEDHIHVFTTPASPSDLALALISPYAATKPRRGPNHRLLTFPALS